MVAEREASAAERHTQLDHLKDVLAERTDQIESLNVDLAGRDGSVVHSWLYLNCPTLTRPPAIFIVILDRA